MSEERFNMEVNPIKVIGSDGATKLDFKGITIYDMSAISTSKRIIDIVEALLAPAKDQVAAGNASAQ